MAEQRMVPVELLKDCLREAGYVENYGLIKRIRALLDGPGVEPIEITAGMVKELRDRTDAPMLECKKALAAARGDMVKAAKILTVYPYRAVTPALMIPDAAIDAARSGGNMTKCLFVHGDYDGEMLDVNPNFPYYLMPRRTHAGAPISGSEAVTKAQQRQSYARHEISDTDNRRHVVYISGGDQLAPILEIIQGYARLAKGSDND